MLHDIPQRSFPRFLQEKMTFSSDSDSPSSLLSSSRARVVGFSTLHEDLLSPLLGLCRQICVNAFSSPMSDGSHLSLHNVYFSSYDDNVGSESAGDIRMVEGQFQHRIDFEI